MLKKNVYLLYQPGFSGSYINWAIHISDLDCRESTVKNPINTQSSLQFGGAGSSHHHTRIPTHQPYFMTANWILLNRPSEPRVYILRDANCARDGIPSSNYADIAISQILQNDPTAVMIAVTNNNDWKISSYGYINGMIKWPVRLLADSKYRGYELPFDVFNCATDRFTRNWLVKNDQAIHSGNPLNRDHIASAAKQYLDWYQCRGSLQPHEVNNKTYIDHIDLTNRIFELNCYDVCTDKFINQFSAIMEQSGISDNFDLEYIREFHHLYCDAQENLKWFDSINHWERTGQLDDYLLSHVCIEACVIDHMFQVLELKRLLAHDPTWIVSYHNIKDPSWPDCPNERSFHLLPEAIKEEMIQQFSYNPISENHLEDLIFLHDNWESMSLEEINQIYQKIISN